MRNASLLVIVTKSVFSGICIVCKYEDNWLKLDFQFTQ